jgi:hypothetical protein
MFIHLKQVARCTLPAWNGRKKVLVAVAIPMAM